MNFTVDMPSGYLKNVLNVIFGCKPPEMDRRLDQTIPPSADYLSWESRPRNNLCKKKETISVLYDFTTRQEDRDGNLVFKKSVKNEVF